MLRFRFVISIVACFHLIYDPHSLFVQCLLSKITFRSGPTVTHPSSPSSLLLHSTSNENVGEVHYHRKLPSTFDIALPASLRGEAVRSAIRSHSSGVLFDFSSFRMPQCNIGGVVVSGRGTARFLEGKLTQTFSDVSSSMNKNMENRAYDNLLIEHGVLKEATLLTPKGHIIDVITVLSLPHADPRHGINEAILLTSPGHAGSALFNRFDPYIFPSDGVRLVDLQVSHPMYPVKEKQQITRVFTVAASKADVAYNTVQRLLIPLFMKESQHINAQDFVLPKEDSNEFIRFSFARRTNEGFGTSLSDQVYINVLHHTFLPSCICKGYTFVITESNEGNQTFADLVWNALVNPVNGDVPISLGPLEWDTLRIEAGFPAFGAEMTGDWSGVEHNAHDDTDTNDESFSFKGQRPSPLAQSLKTYFSLLSNCSIGIRASPLELKLDKMIDTNKGCYQGQEQISAILKNKRGAPRTLYSVSFPDDDNYYDESFHDEKQLLNDVSLEYQAMPPKVGDSLYVLGSNEKIFVGKITSVAERGGTSRPETVAMTMVRRFDSIISAMNDLDLDTNFDEYESALEEDLENNIETIDDGSGILPPPALDPLGGLEVCVGGTFTTGRLKVLPWRRLPYWQNLFEKEVLINSAESSEVSSVMSYIPQPESLGERHTYASQESKDKNESSDKLKQALEEAEVAAKIAEAAIAEAKRKAERLEELKAQVIDQRYEVPEKSSDINSAQESQRKAEKMDVLRRQAEAALERRKQRKMDSTKEND